MLNSAHRAHGAFVNECGLFVLQVRCGSHVHIFSVPGRLGSETASFACEDTFQKVSLKKILNHHFFHNWVTVLQKSFCSTDNVCTIIALVQVVLAALMYFIWTEKTL